MSSALLAHIAAAACLILAAGAHGAVLAQPAPHAQEHDLQREVRKISVDVTARSGGAPIADLLVRLTALRGEVVGRTGPDGRVSLSVEVPADATRAAVYPLATLPLTGTPEQRRQRLKDDEERLNGLSFARWYPVDLAPETDRYQVLMDVAPARKCVVTPAFPGGVQPIALAGSADGSIGTLKLTEEGSPIAVGGLPKGRPSTVYVWNAGLKLQRISVPPGDDDFHAAVKLEPYEEACEVNITILPRPGFGWRPDRGHAGVTLVSLDGQTVIPLFARMIEGVRRTVAGYATTEFPRVPAGTYYIAPGFFNATAPQRAVLERALAGEDLRPLGIPTITTSPGVVARESVHEPSVETALFGDAKTQRP